MVSDDKSLSGLEASLVSTGLHGISSNVAEWFSLRGVMSESWRRFDKLYKVSDLPELLEMALVANVILLVMDEDRLAFATGIGTQANALIFPFEMILNSNSSFLGEKLSLKLAIMGIAEGCLYAYFFLGDIGV
eukprot:NODE_603_length_6200_cov_0.292739.p5 type:complete len:133 gc:universal NODE_603_length_6200_cov_0.292739:4998-4600(-)